MHKRIKHIALFFVLLIGVLGNVFASNLMHDVSKINFEKSAVGAENVKVCAQFSDDALHAYNAMKMASGNALSKAVKFVIKKNNKIGSFDTKVVREALLEALDDPNDLEEASKIFFNDIDELKSVEFVQAFGDNPKLFKAWEKILSSTDDGIKALRTNPTQL